MELNGRPVDARSLEVEGVDSQDFPDFCDAYFSYATWTNGIELTDDELEQLTDVYSDIVNEMAYDTLIGAFE